MPDYIILRNLGGLLSNAHELALLNEGPAVLATLVHIHEPDDSGRSRAQREQEWEAHPVIVGVVDDGLDNVGANN